MRVHYDPSTIDRSVATEWWRMQKSSLNSDFSGLSVRPGLFLALRFVLTWHSQRRPDRKRGSKMAVKSVFREGGVVVLM